LNHLLTNGIWRRHGFAISESKKRSKSTEADNADQRLPCALYTEAHK